MNKQVILAMAFSRSRWVEKFANGFKGALGEYAKLRYSEALGFGDYWSDEINDLLHTVDNLFDPKVIKTKTKFNLYRAAAEGFLEAMNEQKQVLDAKNEFRNHYLTTPEEKKNFNQIARDLRLTSEDLAFELLEKFFVKHQEDILREVQIKLS